MVPYCWVAESSNNGAYKLRKTIQAAIDFGIKSVIVNDDFNHSYCTGILALNQRNLGTYSANLMSQFVLPVQPWYFFVVSIYNKFWLVVRWGFVCLCHGVCGGNRLIYSCIRVCCYCTGVNSKKLLCENHIPDGAGKFSTSFCRCRYLLGGMVLIMTLAGWFI